jgi:cell wall-associated NlpC family hydrolase
LLGACASTQGDREPAFFGRRSALSRLRSKVISEARSHEGQPYVWGANGPDAFDCSGFIHYVMREVVGAEIFDMPYGGIGGRSESVYYRDYLDGEDASISCARAEAADIVFLPAQASGPAHIGFVTKRGSLRFITAQGKDYGVDDHPFSARSYWGKRHPVCFRNVWLERAARR